MFHESALRLGLLGLALAGPSSAQIQLLPPKGDSYQLLRGIVPVVQVQRAVDGSASERLLIDPTDPSLTVEKKPANDGILYRITGKLPTQQHGTLEIDCSLLAQRRPDQVWDLSVSFVSVPNTLSIENLGVALEFEARPGLQQLLVPAFSGVLFEDPLQSIPKENEVDTGFATSMQALAYWSADDSGLLVHALDPTGNEPKRVRCKPVTLGNRSGLRVELSYWMPETEQGGVPRKTPHPIRLQPYALRRGLEDGWYAAAKLYREWLTSEATDAGEILERGLLERREDVPAWLRELDLFVTEQFGWFPKDSLVPDPLLAIERHRKELGAKQIFVGLWDWTDRQSTLGLHGSWFPRPEAYRQFKELLSRDIRVSGYTYPQAFDLRNPLLYALSLWQAGVQDRNGGFVTAIGEGGEPLLTMDVGDPLLAWWFGQLGQFHAREFGLSGFYTDLPVAAGTPDFRRPQGLPTGTSRIGYAGFARILESARTGAAAAKRDFALYHEACFEWLIRGANFGQGTTNLFGRVRPGERRTYAVPFFQAAYAGYTAFWPADPGLGTQTLEFVPDAYGDFGEFNLSRLLAEGVTLGGIPNTSEIFLREGKLFYEKTIGDPAIDAWLQHHKSVLRAAIELRALARPWLGYGELLNDPVAGGDRKTMTLSIPYRDAGIVRESYDKLVVSSQAWRAADESIRIVAFNGSAEKGRVRYDLARLGLTGAPRLVDVVTNEVFGPTLSSSSLVIDVSVPAGSWRLLAVRARE